MDGVYFFMLANIFIAIATFSMLAFGLFMIRKKFRENHQRLVELHSNVWAMLSINSLSLGRPILPRPILTD